MAEIINEIPDEEKQPMEGEEVEVDLEEGKKEAGSKPEKSTADVERVVPEKPQQEELFVEEIDDTPTVDKGKEPLPGKIVDELENDDLEGYSDRVKQRMAQLKKVYHDERRAKEASARERDEAVNYAQKIHAQNNELKQTLSSGEEDYLKTLKSKYDSDLAVAKKDYRVAYDSGDTEQIVEAQSAMNSAQYNVSSAQNIKPQYKYDGQPQENSVQSNLDSLKPKASEPDSRATEWQVENDWFGKDEEMTSLALGVHERLVRSGIDPTSEDYYLRIDETMQKRFPENFEGNSSDAEKPAQRKPSNIVAPATRSNAPKKVRLSKSQVALAKKLKLTPEHYARELLKLENANG